MYGESMGVAVWIVGGIVALVLAISIAVHFWVITVIVVGGAAVLCALIWAAMTIRENIAFGWPWWTP